MKEVPHNSRISQFMKAHPLGILAGFVVALVVFVALWIAYAPQPAFIHERVFLDPPQEVYNARAVVEGDHILGNPDAPVVFIEYSDPECSFCKRNHETMHALLEKFPDEVAWVYRHNILMHKHPKAVLEAESAECVASIGGNDAFWRFLDELFRVTPSNNQFDLDEIPRIVTKSGVSLEEFATCRISQEKRTRVESDDIEARESGLRFTPSMIVLWPDREQRSVIIGARSLEVLTATVNTILGREVSYSPTLDSSSDSGLDANSELPEEIQ